MFVLDAIIGHLVGDYLLQNDWMARNKKSVSWICLIHCVLWTNSVCLFSGCRDHWVWLILLATHFLQDRTTIIRKFMYWAGQEQFATDEKLSPWSIIVVDNVWHIVTIWALWTWLV